MTVTLALPHPDWLAHKLVVSGPAPDVAGFREAAAGAGGIPWRLDLDGLEQDWFLRMLAPPAPEREISVAGARILAATYRTLVGAHHDRVLAACGRSQACPFDLHALAPVPDAVLARGPNDPVSLAWLWRHWGTTQALRRVVVLTQEADARLRRSARVTYAFWSADWSPWPALRTIRARWPSLVFDLRPDYGQAAGVQAKAGQAAEAGRVTADGTGAGRSGGGGQGAAGQQKRAARKRRPKQTPRTRASGPIGRARRPHA